MELFDICDEYGQPTGETVERSIAHRDGIPHRTAHVWIVRKEDHKIQILLQKHHRNNAARESEHVSAFHWRD